MPGLLASALAAKAYEHGRLRDMAHPDIYPYDVLKQILENSKLLEGRGDLVGELLAHCLDGLPGIRPENKVLQRKE